jgi:hypothetical protein
VLPRGVDLDDVVAGAVEEVALAEARRARRADPEADHRVALLPTQRQVLPHLPRVELGPHVVERRPGDHLAAESVPRDRLLLQRDEIRAAFRLASERPDLVREEQRLRRLDQLLHLPLVAVVMRLHMQEAAPP